MNTDNSVLVYIAGAYNAPNIIDALDNMRRGQHLSYEVLKAGFTPYCPFFDYHFSLIGPTSLEEYYRVSMEFLKRSDCVLVVKEGYEKSPGTQKELKFASTLGIPIFYDLGVLIEYWTNQ